MASSSKAKSGQKNFTAARAIPPGDGPVLRVPVCAVPAGTEVEAAQRCFPGVAGRVDLPARAEPPFLGLGDRGGRLSAIPAQLQREPSPVQYTLSGKGQSGHLSDHHRDRTLPWPSPLTVPAKY